MTQEPDDLSGILRARGVDGLREHVDKNGYRFKTEGRINSFNSFLSSREQPDLEAARAFLRTLDPAAKFFTFQTFDDDPGRKNEKLARVLHLMSRNFPSAELLEHHENGAGVFVAVNETDGRGRRTENIIGIRDVWSDDDKGFAGEFRLEPSIIVQTSPGKRQYHWLVADEWPMDESGKADFEAVMERMVASWGCDPGAKGLARVLRVPGFYHQKDPSKPQLVRMVGGCGKRYTRAELVAAFPPVEKKKHHAVGNTPLRDIEEDPERIRDALACVPAADRDTWVRIGMGLKDGLSEAGYPLWLEWSQTAPDKFNARDCRHKWDSFKGKGITIASLFGKARDCGWRDEKRHHNTAVRNEPPRGTEDRADVVAWPILDPAAMHGPAGEIAKLATESTEADPVAVLATTLVLAGAHFGRSRWLPIGDDLHHPRLFAVLVGDTSRARKGTSAAPVLRVFDAAQSRLHGHSTLPFPSGCLLKISPGPLSTGEGLINAIRDKKDDDEDDKGVTDKRLFCQEAELGAALRATQRQGNTLSSILRSAWDGTDLAPMIKTNKITATDPHVCILAHITRPELQELLTTSDVWNGFANRFAWLAVRRTKRQPEPKPMRDEDVARLGQQLAEAIHTTHECRGPCAMSGQAAEYWRAIYDELSKDYTGRLGAVTSRAEALTKRLALVYALLDQAEAIELHHLQAAHALWKYAFDSARLIFGKAELDPVAQTIIEALEAGAKTQTEISGLFHRNKPAAEINGVLASMQSRGRVSLVDRPSGTPGRPSQVWELVR